MTIEVSLIDGCRCIGGNKILVAADGRNVLFDFGTNYSVSKNYFDSFLKEREARGIHDFVEMGMLPRLEIYRDELIEEHTFRALDVDALFVSHAHMDHIGMAGFLDADIPFVATPVTASLMKCIEDTGGGVGAENAYIAKRTGKTGSVLAAAKDPYQGRRMVLTEPSQGCEQFLTERPTKSRTIEGGECLLPDSLGMETKCFPVDHSIYGAAAHAINSEEGWIVYTGDLRTHGKNGTDTWDFADAASRLSPKVLIIEGTRTARQENAVTGQLTEMQVAENCLDECQEADGLIVADFGPRNFERLEAFADIAREIGRELVITAKDAYFLESMRKADGKDRMKGMRIFKPNKGNEEYFECHNGSTEANLIEPRTIRENQESFILCFSIWDMPHLLDIRPEGGTYIYSGSGSFDEEADFDFGRLDNWISKLGMNQVGFEMLEVDGHRGRKVRVPRFNGGLHASGHASREELVRIVDRIKPEYLIPVHTEDPEFFLRYVTSVKQENILLPSGAETLAIE